MFFCGNRKRKIFDIWCPLPQKIYSKWVEKYLRWLTFAMNSWKSVPKVLNITSMSLCHYSTQWWLLPNCWVWWRGGAAVLAWCCRWRGPRTGWQPRQNPALGPATLPPHLRCAALQSRTTARWAPATNQPPCHTATSPHTHIFYLHHIIANTHFSYSHQALNFFLSSY